MPRDGEFLLTSLALRHLTNDWVGGTLTYIPAGIAPDRSGHPDWLLLITFWWVAIGYFCATLAGGLALLAAAQTAALGFGLSGPTPVTNVSHTPPAA